jgi:hypothetical protein
VIHGPGRKLPGRKLPGRKLPGRPKRMAESRLLKGRAVGLGLTRQPSQIRPSSSSAACASVSLPFARPARRKPVPPGPPAPDLSTGALPRRAAASGWRQPGSLAYSRRRGDNARMARDNSKARVQLELFLLALDGIRPAGTLAWVSAAVPVVTQAAVGAGHWAADRRQRALAAWASAGGSALAAWGLGTEAPTRAEMIKNTRQHRDLLRQLGERLPPEAPATAGTHTPQPAIAERPGRPSPGTDRHTDRLRRAVGPAPPAAVDRAHDRQRNLQRRDLCPAGSSGRAAAQAKDRRRPGPVRRRIASPAPGGIG